MQREGDEPLLRAVVQVSLEAAAFGVARLDDAGPRRRELLARVRVRERLRHELRKIQQALLRLAGKRLRVGRRGHDQAPEAPAEVDRCSDRRPVAAPLHSRERIVEVLVVRPLGLARPVDARRRCRRRAQRSRRPNVAPLGHAPGAEQRGDSVVVA